MKLHEAEEFLRYSHAKCLELLGPNSVETADCLECIGLLEEAKQNPSGAAEFYKQSLSVNLLLFTA
jgi:hypothetical protein